MQEVLDLRRGLLRLPNQTRVTEALRARVVAVHYVEAHPERI